MNQSFYIGALGAQQQQKSMNVVSNNLSNVNSYGFKAEKSRFTSLMYQNLQTAEEGEVKSGSGTALWTTDTCFRTGAAAQTGRSQDYMIQGDGFFALVDLSSNEISYTRNGAFSMASRQEVVEKLDEQGESHQQLELVYYLTDGNGRFVLGTDGNMIKMKDPNEKQPVGIFDYPIYNGMEHRDGTRFLANEKNGNLVVGTGELVQGMLETSNVDMAEEMTKVIEAQRAYSMALKVVTASDEVETTINSLRG